MSFDFNAFVAGFSGALLAVLDDGTVAFASEAASALVGVRHGELEGRALRTLVPGRAALPDRGLVAHLMALVERARPAPVVLPLLHASGTEIEFDWRVQPGVAANGAAQAVVVLQKRPESLPAGATRDDALAVHTLVFEAAPIGILHFDARGVITACNDAFVAVLGSSRRKVIGLGMCTLPDKAIVSVVERALAGERVSFEGDYTSVTGKKTTPIRMDLAPLLDERGGVLGGIGLVQDVTEQREAQRRASRAERLASLGTLAAGVVHEVQNPLAFVTASLDLSLRLLDGPEAGAERRADLREAIANAREGATRVANIVRDLKAFARSDEALRGNVDVEAALESALKLVDGQLRTRARLERRYAPLPPVVATEPRLVQLFVNLLVNAIEATPEGAPEAHRISVTTRVEPPVRAGGEPGAPGGGRVRIEIEDEGSGIPREDLARVFEPFWTSKPQGTGLGLAICHGIVAAFGGELWVDTSPAAPARGARLIVTLPVSEQVSATVAPPSPARPAVGSRGRVLVVDDEVLLAQTLRLALSDWHEVDVAHRGDQALERLGEVDYDVILCDLLLPDMSGADVYERATRSRPELAERFAFLTGGAFQERTRQFLQEVSHPRLEKPFDLEALEELVARLVARRRPGDAVATR